jgi:hypothetical protein
MTPPFPQGTIDYPFMIGTASIALPARFSVL